MNSKYLVRKIHRYFGVVIGIQFLLWTVGGLYFAWTNIEEIRGNHLVHHEDVLIMKEQMKTPTEVISLNQIPLVSVKEIRLTSLFLDSFYEIHTDENMMLVNVETGKLRDLISKDEVTEIVQKKLKKEAAIKKIEWVSKENIKNHLQYRGGKLPAWAVELKDDSNTIIYVCATRGTIEKVRTKQWRIFDYLWMLHIMDYDDRDNINNTILRAFSILGLITILSGFILFFQSSKTIRTIKSIKSS